MTDGYPGMFHAVVSDTADPEKSGRVRAKIPGIYTNPSTGEIIDSPWIFPKGGMFGEAGSLNVPPVGAHIWVSTVYHDDGEIYELVYDHGTHAVLNEPARTPKVGKGEDDETCVGLKAGTPFSVPSARRMMKIDKRLRENSRDMDPKTNDELEGIPPSANAGEYPDNRVLKTPAGIVIELDDTAGEERIHVWHPSGSYIEFTAKGVRVDRQAKSWTETTENRTEYIGGRERKRVDSHRQTGIGGNDVTEVEGRRVITAREIDESIAAHRVSAVGGVQHTTVRGKTRGRYLGGRRDSVIGDDDAACTGSRSITSMEDMIISAGLPGLPKKLRLACGGGVEAGPISLTLAQEALSFGGVAGLLGDLPDAPVGVNVPKVPEILPPYSVALADPLVLLLEILAFGLKTVPVTKPIGDTWGDILKILKDNGLLKADYLKAV